MYAGDWRKTAMKARSQTPFVRARFFFMAICPGRNTKKRGWGTPPQGNYTTNSMSGVKVVTPCQGSRGDRIEPASRRIDIRKRQLTIVDAVRQEDIDVFLQRVDPAAGSCESSMPECVRRQVRTS